MIKWHKVTNEQSTYLEIETDKLKPNTFGELSDLQEKEMERIGGTYNNQPDNAQLEQEYENVFQQRIALAGIEADLQNSWFQTNANPLRALKAGLFGRGNTTEAERQERDKAVDATPIDKVAEKIKDEISFLEKQRVKYGLDTKQEKQLAALTALEIKVKKGFAPPKLPNAVQPESIHGRRDEEEERKKEALTNLAENQSRELRSQLKSVGANLSTIATQPASFNIPPYARQGLSGFAREDQTTTKYSRLQKLMSTEGKIVRNATGAEAMKYYHIRMARDLVGDSNLPISTLVRTLEQYIAENGGSTGKMDELKDKNFEFQGKTYNVVEADEIVDVLKSLQK